MFRLIHIIKGALRTNDLPVEEVGIQKTSPCVVPASLLTNLFLKLRSSLVLHHVDIRNQKKVKNNLVCVNVLVGTHHDTIRVVLQLMHYRK